MPDYGLGIENFFGFVSVLCSSFADSGTGIKLSNPDYDPQIHEPNSLIYEQDQQGAQTSLQGTVLFKCKLKRNSIEALNCNNFKVHMIQPQYHANDQDVDGQIVCEGLLAEVLIYAKSFGYSLGGKEAQNQSKSSKKIIEVSESEDDDDSSQQQPNHLSNEETDEKKALISKPKQRKSEQGFMQVKQIVEKNLHKKLLQIQEQQQLALYEMLMQRYFKNNDNNQLKKATKVIKILNQMKEPNKSPSPKKNLKLDPNQLDKTPQAKKKGGLFSCCGAKAKE